MNINLLKKMQFIYEIILRKYLIKKILNIKSSKNAFQIIFKKKLWKIKRNVNKIVI